MAQGECFPASPAMGWLGKHFNERETEMKLTPDEFGRITPDYPPVFCRVSTWATERRGADFTQEDEARLFAISDAKATGARYDHKVGTMRVSR